MALQWQDSGKRYGVVSRVLHWGMAGLFAWQFFGMACKVLLGKTPLTSFMVGTHGPVGALLMLTIVLRLLWAFGQRGRRPGYQAGAGGMLARMGHWMLYLLMFLVPALALLRQYGSGRGFAPWGVTLMEKTGERIEWLMAPANAVHGLFGWVLLALIVGHVVVALAHHFLLRDGILFRMAGRRSP